MSKKKKKVKGPLDEKLEQLIVRPADVNQLLRAGDVNHQKGVVTFESFTPNAGFISIDGYVYYISGSNGCSRFKVSDIPTIVEELTEIREHLRIREQFKRL